MIITEADRGMLLYAKRDSNGFHLATDWYLRGWRPIPYHYKWHYIDLPNATWLGGIATGKTAGETASILMDCISTPYFRALSTSVTAKQAELGFDMTMGWLDGNYKLEHLIEDITLKPYPVIKFKNYSEYEFRTAGTDARFIRGSEYDRIGYDEPGLDPIGETVRVLRGRLRGKRIDGMGGMVSRMARLDVFGSPAAVVWLKERFERGFDPKFQEQYFSMRTATWDNPHISKQQLEAMIAEMPPEMVEVELGGKLPDFGANFFPHSHINACVNQSLYDAAYIALNPEDPKEKPKPGYVLEEDPRHGIYKFELPYQPGHRYILAGDPGSKNFPSRGAGCVMVADATYLPHLRMSYLHWVSGGGSINPFLNSYKYALDKYYPEFKGIDATGSQTYMDELAFQNHGILTDKINFGKDKDAMLNALLYDVNNQRWFVPPVSGLIRQAQRYNRQMDGKIPQDLIMTWAQISLLARMMPKEARAGTPQKPDPRRTPRYRRGRPGRVRQHPYDRR